MVNCILADMRRVYRRIPRLIALAALYILVTVVFAQLSKENMKGSYMLVLVEHFVVGNIPLVLGLIEMFVIFADDFGAKSMQSAIGLGIGRRKVVLTKLADFAILVFIDILIFGLIIAVTGVVQNMGLGGEPMREFILSLGVAWLKSVAYASLAMILAFYSQNALFALLAYIALASGLVKWALGIMLGFKALAPLHLERFLLTSQANAFYTQLLLGRFSIGALMAVVLYIAAGVAATWYLYSGIELEL